MNSSEEKGIQKEIQHIQMREREREKKKRRESERERETEKEYGEKCTHRSGLKPDELLKSKLNVKQDPMPEKMARKNSCKQNGVGDR